MTAEDVLPAQHRRRSACPTRRTSAGTRTSATAGSTSPAAMKRIDDRPRSRPRPRSTRPTGSRRSTSTALRRRACRSRGHVAAPHSGAGVGAWELEYACGQDAPDSAFQPMPGRQRHRRRRRRRSARSRRPLLDDLADTCDGEVANDAGRPAGAAADGAGPPTPIPNPDPERHAFQIRLTVHEAGDPDNFGRYRKTLFAYRDDGNLAGWPQADRHRLRRRATTSPARAARSRRASTTSTATTSST